MLRQEADARGVFLSDDAMDFILSRFSRDLGNLMQLLDQLDAYALQTQRAITIPLIKSMLENLRQHLSASPCAAKGRSEQAPPPRRAASYAKRQA